MAFITPCLGFHCGKTAPGGGHSSRGPPIGHILCTLPDSQT